MTLAAPEGAATTGFDPTTLSVVANEPIELDFKNQDPGIQHNVVIFEEDPADSPDAAPLFSGELVAGVVDSRLPRAAAAGRVVLLPLRGASDDDDRNDRVREGEGGRR